MKDGTGKIAAAFDILDLPGQNNFVTHLLVEGTDFHQSKIGYFAIDIVKDDPVQVNKPLLL